MLADPDSWPYLAQIIDTKKIKPANGTGGDRYRIVLSDGVNFMSGMLATQLAFVRHSVDWMRAASV